MKSIFSVQETKLRWVPRTRGYELLAGDEVVARIGRSLIAPSRAFAETGDIDWTLERSGSYSGVVTIYRGKEEKIGFLKQRDGSRSQLLLLDGTLFTCTPAYERGRYSWKFSDAQEQTLFVLTVGFEGALTARVELAPPARDVEHLPLVLVTGWFELWMEYENAERPRAGTKA